MSSSSSLSAVQRQVLSLYRRSLRLASLKQPQLISHVRSEFRLGSQLARRDFAQIDYRIRKLKKEIEIFEMPGVKKLSFKSTESK